MSDIENLHPVVLQETFEPVRLPSGRPFASRADRRAASAVRVPPSGWTLSDAAKFAAEHVSRIKISLTIDEAVNRFLENRERRSDMHYKDLNRRLNRLFEC